MNLPPHPGPPPVGERENHLSGLLLSSAVSAGFISSVCESSFREISPPCLQSPGLVGWSDSFGCLTRNLRFEARKGTARPQVNEFAHFTDGQSMVMRIKVL